MGIRLAGVVPSEEYQKQALWEPSATTEYYRSEWGCAETSHVLLSGAYKVLREAEGKPLWGGLEAILR